MNGRGTTSVMVRALVTVGGLLLSTGADAQLAEQVPPELEQVGVVEHLDVPIPLDLEFVDSSGTTVRLGDYFDGERPVVLTLNYYR